MIYVGLDYHTKDSQISIWNETGEEVWNGRVDSQAELAEMLRQLPDAKVLFEAGYGWPRLVKALDGAGVELKMCHPAENRKIATDRRKSDSRDAKNLAVYLKAGVFKEAYMPDDEVRDERQLVRTRTNLTREITMAKNRIHSLLAYAGIPKQSDNIFAKKRRWYLETVEVPENTRLVLDAEIKALDFLGGLRMDLDKRLAELNRRDPRARLLKTIPGVGGFTARVILAEMGEIDRFSTAKAFSCYCGLTPKQHQSGSTMRTMGITKEGSSHLRWVLVQAAWVAVRRDPAFRETFEKLREEKNAPTAICAVARKLSVAAWYILNDNVPFRASKPGTEGQPVEPRGKSGHQP